MIQIEEVLKDSAVLEMSDGAFNNRSYCGYSGKILKSGICKYFRREKFEKFKWCCMEMMLFGIKSERLVTNLINRLHILLMEEICCNSENLVDAVVLLKSIKNEKKLDVKMKKINLFCDVISHSKKGRICSYVNNWWKYNKDEYETKEIKKVLEYKKKNDSDEVLYIGEKLISYIEKNDQRIFACYNRLYDYGEAGQRYRRKDAIYLYWEIIEKYFCKDDKTRILFEFGLEMFHRKNMKERKAFGIWIGLLVLNRNVLNYKCIVDANRVEFDIINYLQSHEKIEINEDFVINDFHVNKKFGKRKFAEVGSYVNNECEDLLGEMFKKYKDFYIEKKSEEDSIPKKAKTEKVKIGKAKIEKKNEENLKKINFYEEFEVEKIIHDGVCGMKKPCIIVKCLKSGKLFVLKEMSVNSLNKGVDYMFIDSLKKEFGLLDLEMERIVSDIGIVLKDKTIRQYKNNCKLDIVIKPVYFCKMKFMQNQGDLVSHKNIMDNLDVKCEMLIIRLFDGLFRSSDNNLRNILVGTNNRLISIDEGDIFGKRKNIFKKNDWCVKDKWCRENVVEVIENHIFGKGRKDLIIKRLKEYNFPDEMTEEFKNRYDNYVDIVKKEFEI